MWRLGRNNPEVIENINQGQIVVITARWILILIGWVLVLWLPEPTAAWQLRTAIVLLMAYSSMNFFLTVQWVNRSRLLADAVLVTSVVDLALVTTLVAVFGTANVYVFYLPALLALSVTFPRVTTALCAGSIVVLYSLIALAKAGDYLDTAEAQSIFVRVIVLAAVAFCGSLYREIEADRRQGKGRIFVLFKDMSPNQQRSRPITRDKRPTGCGRSARHGLCA